MYLSVAALDSLSSQLAAWFPHYFTRFALPEPSVQGRPVYALRLRAGGGESRRGVMVVGGTHSRELMNPDAIIELAVDLFIAHYNGTGVTYGGAQWSALDVKLILETLDLWLVPCMNPDGREYVMNVDNLWRKNRCDNPGTECDGVDLNRNFDIVWGVTGSNTSCAQCSDLYCGPQAFSEPETRNIRNVLDTRLVNCFVDVHSYSELVLWPWGHAPSQTTDPTKRFTTLPTGTCAPIAIPGYQEYILPQDLQRFQTVGARIVNAIAAVRGRHYTSEPSIALYPTTGSQSDYAYSRHIANPKLNKTYGFTFETGPYAGSAANSFHPADPTLIKRDTKAGIIALMQQCICSIELIGVKFFESDAEIEALRHVRDDLLATTDAGRAWIALFERAQVPLLASLMSNEKLAAQAAELIKTAAELAKSDRKRVKDADIDAGIQLVRALAKVPEAGDVRGDLKAVDGRLDAMRGLTMSRAVALLMAEPPGSRTAKKRR
jgi:murein tripeptide amidase MpaA